MMRFYAVILFLLFAFTPISVFCDDCGKKTSEVPASSSESEFLTGGQIKSLRGRVSLPDGEKAEFVIVEVYRNNLTIPYEEITYIQADEILKSGRIAARDTKMSGKFCFKNLKAGNYMLRMNIIGTNSLSYLTTMYVFVTVDPKIKENISGEVEVEFGLAI